MLPEIYFLKSSHTSRFLQNDEKIKENIIF
jgi:hypothetical protein